MAAQPDARFAGTLTPDAPHTYTYTYTPTWEDSHCLNCGREARELFGGWCIDCAGPVDYPWWCETCQDFHHADVVKHRTCPDCGERVIWVGSETYESEAA